MNLSRKCGVNEMKLVEICPIVERLAVTIAGVKYYKRIDYLKKSKEKIRGDYEVDFRGGVIFYVDAETGKAHTCTNVGKFKFSTGSSFWKECFREQVPIIKRLFFMSPGVASSFKMNFRTTPVSRIMISQI